MLKFRNKTQQKRWEDYVVFFQKIVDLQNKGKTIFYNCGEIGDILEKIVINLECGEIYGLTESGNSRLRTMWVGSEFDIDPKTGEYDCLHISTPLPKLIKENNFRYYEKEIKIK